MNERCAHCGGAATLLLTEAGEERSLCSLCVDRMLPNIRLSRVREALTFPREQIGKCPYCGWTQTQLQTVGLVGCPLCYEALDIQALLNASA